jgi:hypothetical protein
MLLGADETGWETYCAGCCYLRERRDFCGCFYVDLNEHGIVIYGLTNGTGISKLTPWYCTLWYSTTWGYSRHVNN